MSELKYRRFACPLHYGLRYSLECVDCRSMPAVLPDGTLIDSTFGATTEFLRRWTRQLVAEKNDVATCRRVVEICRAEGEGK